MNWVDVTHTSLREAIEHTFGVDEIAASLADASDRKIELHATRPRPPGAMSTHHVDDVVLRARRLPG